MIKGKEYGKLLWWPKNSTTLASVISGPVLAKAGIDREPRNIRESRNPGS